MYRDMSIILLSVLFMMSPDHLPSHCGKPSDEIVAEAASQELSLDAANPSSQWQRAVPVRFCTDWQGQNPHPKRQTEVRALWTPLTLYLRFECDYQELFLFTDSSPNGRRDHLWDRDVAEAFLQPDPSQPRSYKEFEISPNGFWIDLDISPAGDKDLKSGLRRSVWLNEKSHRWAAEVAIPMTALTSHFDASAVWRANFYRVEGSKEPRAYLAWQPTDSPQPNFHVPEKFGRMRFASGAGR